jgi:4-amino-4-deoxy-L-arabinose transferase-like glycosyltransferase
MIAGLPGLFLVPPLDRDESRFAQATAQMLETGDFVVINFQDQPRFKKPVGIHWLQAASVSLLSAAEAREIWAYRIPSLLGAMLAAAACAWGARAFFGGPAALLAGGLLASTLLLSTEAFIAKTDAVMTGASTLALAAMAHAYAAARGGAPAGRAAPLLFWLGLSLATLVKGPVGPMVVLLTALTLWAWDRKAEWVRTLGWGWGPILFLAIVGPWAWAVTVATDGGFWTTAIAGDLAPKLAGGQETHGAPFGYHTALVWLLFFPGSLLIPAALAQAWKGRSEPGVRFAVAWLVPAWLVFELTPTKLVHYPLPTYGALAWLAAVAVARAPGPISRWSGAALSALSGAALGGGVVYLLSEYGDRADVTAAAVTGGLFLTAGVGAAILFLRGATRGALIFACALGVLAHGVLAGAMLPGLQPLWLSARVEQTLAGARLLPRQGIAPAPVAVAGYAEPSLVFALGTPTDLGGAKEAADAIAEHRPAVVEDREAQAFRAELAARNLKVRPMGEVRGLDYSNGDDMVLRIYAAPSQTEINP